MALIFETVCCLSSGASAGLVRGSVDPRQAPPASSPIYNRKVPVESSSPIIVAEKLTKVYMAGRVAVPALRGVSLTIDRGEFVAIVGPSGSGKSTLFYVLGGLTQPPQAASLIDGVDFATLADAERTRMRKQRIGFVFQRFNLLPTLTAHGKYRDRLRHQRPQGAPRSAIWTISATC